MTNIVASPKLGNFKNKAYAVILTFHLCLYFMVSDRMLNSNKTIFEYLHHIKTGKTFMAFFDHDILGID